MPPWVRMQFREASLIVRHLRGRFQIVLAVGKSQPAELGDRGVMPNRRQHIVLAPGQFGQHRRIGGRFLPQRAVLGQRERRCGCRRRAFCQRCDPRMQAGRGRIARRFRANACAQRDCLVEDATYCDDDEADAPSQF